MKILLFGKDGQVGWELQRSLAPLGNVVALGTKGDGVMAGNFLDPEGIARTVRAVQPEVIVNAAAYTAVDKAESDQVVARQVNALTPGVLAREAQACGSLLVHYSTDYVFDGSGQAPWREGDATGPLNVYGATKLEGERLVAQHCPHHLVLRTSWVYAARGGNFAKTMLRLALQRERLTVIDDQHGAPTSADLLADLTAHMVRAALDRSALAGTYHAAAAGETTWNGYARLVLQQAAQAGVALKAPADAVDPVTTDAFPAAARRPLNSRLDTAKLRRTFGLQLPPWQAGVARMLAEVLRPGEEISI
ncbi:MAG TPA: dTDP-4-dehydrorhamnose reductase [Ramlibacter sp.]|jgi:dTDP-4-dehydrorhamnose reductase|uniref:dTDP-4-dehydrorhamnose reductase n=1 Tax=Ramlibacter sp. TaxID=1917967 RepID=UPI002D3DC6CB|nr:dTDP-4-dehydrorhamnose reductase [Ramlibacter sp.]HZY20059.1 dTDP-4-dehydrorhamnose reductase [Ramlibacter sp.]